MVNYRVSLRGDMLSLDGVSLTGSPESNGGVKNALLDSYRVFHDEFDSPGMDACLGEREVNVEAVIDGDVFDFVSRVKEIFTDNGLDVNWYGILSDKVISGD